MSYSLSFSPPAFLFCSVLQEAGGRPWSQWWAAVRVSASAAATQDGGALAAALPRIPPPSPG